MKTQTLLDLKTFVCASAATAVTMLIVGGFVQTTSAVPTARNSQISLDNVLHAGQTAVAVLLD